MPDPTAETLAKPPQVTRIPPYPVGSWVKVRTIPGCGAGSDLSGRVLRVKSLTCAFTREGQRSAAWFIHFPDGRCCDWKQIERVATEAEIRAALARMN